MQETESEEGYCKLQRIQEMTLMLMLMLKMSQLCNFRISTQTAKASTERTNTYKCFAEDYQTEHRRQAFNCILLLGEVNCPVHLIQQRDLRQICAIACCAQHLTSLTNWKTWRNLREISATKKHIQCTFIEKELLGFLWYEIILYKQRLIKLFGSYVGPYTTSSYWISSIVLDYQEGSITVQVILLDNAKVHSAAVLREEHQALTAQYIVYYYFIPTYSPELNATKLLFACLKGKIYECASDCPILGDLIQEVAPVTTADVAKMYKH
ncbi:hypothetical protein PROFUN_16285 [Planoprotostelium fungivorum]|uniref:Tc1-like transposase DDE domain-containing protein n=1 Tax=Planoprotostelium fungivorum TaxID=1890364 RepID=A0A2P6MR89_9EUKA|nr:hypothetical protein PROFUN_16285 [Planoprotostelium fungivorum]